MEEFLKDFDAFSQSWWPYVVSLLITVITAIRVYFGGTKCPSNETMEGKNVIITGGSSGIGLETAIQLAERGGNIILTARNAEKGRKAIEYINSLVPDANVVMKLLDVSEMTSIRDFVHQLENEYDHIDVLINNAGVIFQPFSRTMEGNEITMATNYFGPFLLTHLLLKQLNKSENGRVINITAQAQYNGKIDLDNLNSEKKFKESEVFANSKLALTIFTKQMASLCKKSKITFNCVNPGLVRGTQHLRNSLLQTSCLTRLMMWPFMWMLMKNPTQGCQTIIYLAVESSLKPVSGCYFCECEIKEPPEAALDTELSDKLYDATCKIVDIDKEKIFAQAFDEYQEINEPELACCKLVSAMQ